MNSKFTRIIPISEIINDDILLNKLKKAIKSKGSIYTNAMDVIKSNQDILFVMIESTSNPLNSYSDKAIISWIKKLLK